MPRLARFGVVLALAVAANGCESLVSRASEEDASWKYVVEAWGGLSVGEPVVAGEKVHLPLKIQNGKVSRIDSAVCVGNEVKTAVRGKTIALTLTRCLCSSSCSAPAPDLQADFSRPLPGNYEIVYQGPDGQVNLRSGVIFR
jgi:hypothetical protein